MRRAAFVSPAVIAYSRRAEVAEPMANSIALIELLVLHGALIGWAVWEYRKTDALHKKTLEEERARRTGERAD